jgi:hypothetical protein
MISIESQLHPTEKAILSGNVRAIPNPTILEIGTFKGGGSTLAFLEALKRKGAGKLIGIEADPDVFVEMKTNIASVDPEYFAFFEPISGFSQRVIPGLLTKYQLLKDAIPVGGYVFSHDANLRKGHWFVPYISQLDNWKVTLHQVSEEGLLEAEKLGDSPSTASLRRAQGMLRRKMLSPVELATLFFPSSFKGFVLKLLPLKIRRRIGEGRK